MASKRITNRLYWASIKAIAAHPHDDPYWFTIAYELAMRGNPDSAVIDSLQRLEAAYGPHRPHKDLDNRSLWEARKYVDGRREYLSQK